MTFKVSLAQSIDNLRSDRHRTILTTMGIAWGIASFIILVAVAGGVQTGFSRLIGRWGTDVITIYPGKTESQAGVERQGNFTQLDAADVELLNRNAPMLGLATPEKSTTVLYKSGPRSISAPLFGVKQEYQGLRNIELDAGRFVSEFDDQRISRVIVLGSEVRRRLFGNQPCIGDYVEVAGLRFSVIGIVRAKSLVGGHELDRRAYIPISSFRLIDDNPRLSAILIRPVQRSLHRAAGAQARHVLSQAHHFPPEDKDVLRLNDIIQTLSTFDMMALGFKAVWGLLGMITLGVGGVGVMNIMFVSVVERTREIGIRKALGARKVDIVIQFVLESVSITFLGGIAGVIVGILGCVLLPSISMGDAQAVLIVSPWSIIAAFGLLAAVGILAGFWPALKAARLQPLEALRYQ